MSTQTAEPIPQGSSFPDRDKLRILSLGWFPKTNIEVMEELRVEHERLLAQMDEKRGTVYALAEKYKQEDLAKQQALDKAYREGKKPKEPKLTSAADRQAVLADAEAHHTAAKRAVLAFGYEAVEKLRGKVPGGWHAADANNTMRVPPNGDAAQIAKGIRETIDAARERVAEAQRVIAQADAEMREFQPLSVWLVRTANAGIDGSPWLMAGDDLPVPQRHTFFAKPVDTPDPADWPSQRAVGEGETYPIPDDAEHGSVDESDPWFVGIDTEHDPKKEI